MNALEKLLDKHDACTEAREWAEPYETLQDAWNACERADWMCWLLVHMYPGGYQKNTVRLVLCACAETAIKYVPKGEPRPAHTILTARKHALGLATDEELAAAGGAAGDAARGAARAAARAAAGAAAWNAAWDAAWNAAWGAAWGAAGDAAWAAAWAAAGDAAGDAAWAAALRDMADIIRAMIPDPAKLPKPETLWNPEGAC